MDVLLWIVAGVAVLYLGALLTRLVGPDAKQIA
jgi:hypothetical protein